MSPITVFLEEDEEECTLFSGSHCFH